MARRPMHTGPRGPVVRRIPLDAISLATDTGGDLYESPEGAIVRVKLPAGTEDEEVRAVVESWVSSGAARVIVEPSPKPAIVPNNALLERRGTPREVVLVLLEESNVEDKDALRSLVERVLSEEGL